MVRRRRVVRRVRRRRPQIGAGFFGDLWSGIKKAGRFIKDQKLISRGLGLINDPRAKTASSIASQLGLGRRRRVVRRRRQLGGYSAGMNF